eukprot:6178646-Pleurochrysis_carterae.AAC.1
MTETADRSNDDCVPVNARAATAAAASGAASAPAKPAPSAGAADGQNVNVDSMSGSDSAATCVGVRLRNERAWVKKGASEFSFSSPPPPTSPDAWTVHSPRFHYLTARTAARPTPRFGELDVRHVQDGHERRVRSRLCQACRG